MLLERAKRTIANVDLAAGQRVFRDSVKAFGQHSLHEEADTVGEDAGDIELQRRSTSAAP